MLGPTEHPGAGEIPGASLGSGRRVDVTEGMFVPCFGDSHTTPAVGDIHAGLWVGDMLTGVKGHVPLADDVNMPEFRDTETTHSVGDMHAGIIHTGLRGGSHVLLSAGALETGRVRSCGIIHSDLLSDVDCAGIGEIGTGPARSCGHMETTFISVTPTGNGGAMPIGPAKSCGDIYATGSVQHAGDIQTTLAAGNMYAGLWAGQMYTGAARRCGDMETT